MSVREAHDMYGKSFGFLKVLGRGKGPGTAAYWECRCTAPGCDNIKSVRADNLRGGKQSSCGCMRDKHPGKTYREVLVWKRDFVNGLGGEAEDVELNRLCDLGYIDEALDEALESWRLGSPVTGPLVIPDIFADEDPDEAWAQELADRARRGMR